MSERFTEIDQLANGTSSNKVIEIKSIYKSGKHTVQPAFDPKTGWYAGVERLSDEQKKTRQYYVNVGLTKEEARHNTKIVLKSGDSFDLNNPIDAINWEWLKHLPCIAMSYEEAQQGKALFYVHIEGREAELANTRTEGWLEAMNLVNDDPSTNYVNRALLLGFDMEGEETASIKEFLFATAKESPKKIFRIYRDKSMQIYLLFAKAKKAGHIVKDEVNGVFRYGSNILGVSEEASIAFLQQEEGILELLERDTKPEYFTKKQELRTSETALEKARRIKSESAGK